MRTRWRGFATGKVSVWRGVSTQMTQIYADNKYLEIQYESINQTYKNLRKFALFASFAFNHKKL